jgi:hypothetical protein
LLMTVATNGSRRNDRRVTRNVLPGWLPSRIYLSAVVVAAAAVVFVVFQFNAHGVAVLGYSWLQSQLLSHEYSASREDRTPLAPAAQVKGCLLAFSDIHGDLQQAQKVLQLVGATDHNGKWAAGSCTLVQTGDLVDRGHDSIAVLELFDQLKMEAALAGGQLITLMGNHEMESIQVASLIPVHPILLVALRAAQLPLKAIKQAC